MTTSLARGSLAAKGGGRILVFAGGLLLAAVFATAAITKLLDLSGSREAIEAFGLPTELAKPFGVALPLTELAIAIALLFEATAAWGALAALILLIAFSFAIAWNLARGRTPDCHCFGERRRSPIGWPSLLRNGGLAALAALMLVYASERADPGIVAWAADLSAGQLSTLIGAAMIASLAYFCLHLLRAHGRLLLRIDAVEEALAKGMRAGGINASHAGLPIGTAAPDFDVSDLDGGAVRLEDLLRGGKPLIVLFSDPGCFSCSELAPDVGLWQREERQPVAIAVISRSELEGHRSWAAEHELQHVLLQRDQEVSEAYGATGTPSAVLISPYGQIASVLVSGPRAVRELFASAVADRDQRSSATHEGTASDGPDARELNGHDPIAPIALPRGGF